MGAIAGTLLLGFSASGQSATLLSSSDFSFGYGAEKLAATTSPELNTWVLKTSSSTVDGDFTFQTALHGSSHSLRGPLYNGTALLSTNNGSTNYTGYTLNATLTVSGAWSGDPLLIGEDLLAEDLQFRLVITSIQVYATYYSPNADTAAPTLTLVETTPGYEQSHATVSVVKTVGAGNGNQDALTKAENYTLLEWTPENYWIEGTDFTRTFSLQPEGLVGTSGAAVHIDGFQITGYIEVIPEPSSFVLMTGGLGALLFYCRARRAVA